LKHALRAAKQRACGRLWYDTPDHAIGYAQHYRRSHDAVIRVYDAAGNVIETHEHKEDFKETIESRHKKKSGHL
jgi:hypothetical protein